MAGIFKDSETEYVLKKGENDVPVDACKGWIEPCEYCDKRFSEWIEINDDVYEKIPVKPGFFMIALKNKSVTEVVSILYEKSNVQDIAVTEVDKIKEQISNKKSKYTKSAVLVRWMVMKKTTDKENSILCAHWVNNGILPKFLTSWPGQKLLEESEAVVFSKKIQKWCYPQKNPTWRKSKPPPPKNVEQVTKCNLESCEICDSYFSKWQLVSDVVEKDLAPSDQGIIMFSAAYGKCREVVLIRCNPKTVVLPIKSTIKDYYRNEKYFLRDKKFEGKNARFEVRWMPLKDVDSDNSCFMYAHWFNADRWPMHNASHMPLPGETSLNKNKHFVYRTNDKKWFYETETLKPTKSSKSKNRRKILDELEDELNNEYES